MSEFLLPKFWWGGVRFVVFLLYLLLNYEITKSQPEPLVHTTQFYGDSCLGVYDVLSSFKRTHDSGFILAGYTQRFEFAQSQIWLVHTDSLGNLQWEYGYGAECCEYGSDVLQASDGSFVVAGYGDEGTGMSLFTLLKTDSSGNQIWLRRYEETQRQGAAYALVQTAEGGFALAGNTVGDSTIAPDMCLLKTNANGDVQWVRRYDNGAREWAYSLALTADGGFILAGEYSPEDTAYKDLFVVRANSQGDTLWQQLYPRPESQVIPSIHEQNDGSFIVSGSDYPTGNIFLSHLSSDGNVLWWRTIGDSDSVESSSSVILLEDGYAIVGSSGISFSRLIYLGKTDFNGNLVWHRTFNLRDHSQGADILALEDHKFALCGTASCSPSGQTHPPDGFLLITGPDGGNTSPPNYVLLPDSYAVKLYPNPFNNAARVVLSLPASGEITAALFNLNGRWVQQIFKGSLPAGEHQLKIEGSSLPTGVYFLHVKTRLSSTTHKVLLLK